eukprot:1159223-Pelagomonas_calceolata.AAC.5
MRGNVHTYMGNTQPGARAIIAHMQTVKQLWRSVGKKHKKVSCIIAQVQLTARVIETQQEQCNSSKALPA